MHEQGPGTDKAHLTPEDMDQLGQLIQGTGAQQASESGQAFGVGQELAVGPAGLCHGPEFDQPKRLTVLPGALLPEKNRPANQDRNQEPDQHKQGAPKRKAQENKDTIKEALSHAPLASWRRWGIRKYRKTESRFLYPDIARQEEFPKHLKYAKVPSPN
jgi:hypothetical protein